MERGRVGLMSTSLLAANGVPSLERILCTRVAGDMRLFPMYGSTRFVCTYLPLQRGLVRPLAVEPFATER